MEIIEYICEKCGNNQSYKKFFQGKEYGECTKCGNLTYNHYVSKKQLIRCPYCNSYKVEKISKTTKITHTALFGLASMKKVNSNWHCNNCKSDF